ncbi:MAG: type II secretion system F family protein [Algiphilus sp.]|uniref:type II secretion system F family protein n=1 Tax=Algiphilus sp. TaxID=1872431 RepID=UPI0032EC2CC3
MGLLIGRARRDRRIRRRLVSDEPSSQEPYGNAEGLIDELADTGRSIERLVNTDRETPRLLVQAGLRSREPQTVYYVIQLVSPILIIGLIVFVWVLRPEAAPAPIFLSYLVVGALVGLFGPRYFLRKRAEARQRRIATEVPLFIHLLVLLFEAGLSTRQALASLTREGRGTLPELNREFAVVTRQLEAGGDTVEVLRNLEQALNVADLSHVLGVLRQVDRYGGEIRQPLLEALGALEERRVMDTREKVNATAGRMTVVMVLFFFPALLIFVAGPAFVTITETLRGAGS